MTSGPPDLDLARIRAWCEARVPAHVRDRIRVAADVEARHVTIVECRPPWDAPDAELPQWTRHPVARLRWTRTTRLWTLYWSDRNLQFHVYPQIEPTPFVEVLLAEVEQDPTAIFWG